MPSPIRVYGEDAQDVQLVAEYLIQYEQLCFAAKSKEEEETNAIASAITQGDEDTAQRVLSIRTKYYNADLELALHTFSESTSCEISEGCECCILVVSSSKVQAHVLRTCVSLLYCQLK